jgi:hypothetical protein
MSVLDPTVRQYPVQSAIGAQEGSDFVSSAATDIIVDFHQQPQLLRKICAVQEDIARLLPDLFHALMAPMALFLVRKAYPLVCCVLLAIFALKEQFHSK